MKGGTVFVKHKKMNHHLVVHMQIITILCNLQYKVTFPQCSIIILLSMHVACVYLMDLTDL